MNLPNRAVLPLLFAASLAAQTARAQTDTGQTDVSQAAEVQAQAPRPGQPQPPTPPQQNFQMHPPQLALSQILEDLSQFARPGATHLSRAQATVLLPVLSGLQGQQILPGPVAALILRQVLAVLTPEQISTLLGSDQRHLMPRGQGAGPRMQGRPPSGPMPMPPQGQLPPQDPQVQSASTPSVQQAQVPPQGEQLRQNSSMPQSPSMPQNRSSPRSLRAQQGAAGDRDTNPFFSSPTAQHLQHLIAELSRIARTE